MFDILAAAAEGGAAAVVAVSKVVVAEFEETTPLRSCFPSHADAVVVAAAQPLRPVVGLGYTGRSSTQRYRHHCAMLAVTLAAAMTVGWQAAEPCAAAPKRLHLGVQPLQALRMEYPPRRHRPATDDECSFLDTSETRSTTRTKIRCSNFSRRTHFLRGGGSVL